MKRLIALILAGLMVLGGASFAAEWREGCSPAQPYSNLPEVNLSKTMGYIMLFPRTKLPASVFCDVLRMYLPRTDLKLGSGKAHLYENVDGGKRSVEVCAVSFSEPGSVEIREMTENELQDFIWGSGSCVEMHLSKSLEFGDKVHDYYVQMDEGCFTAENGSLKSISINNKDAWIPAINGDYGVSGLHYVDGPAMKKKNDAAPAAADDKSQVTAETPDGGDSEANDEVKETPTPAPTEAPKQKAATGTIVTKPEAGDKVRFDLVLGGDAKLAVMFSDNGSVEFDEIEFNQSGPVEGTITGDEVQWGVAFYDANGYVFDAVRIGD